MFWLISEDTELSTSRAICVTDAGVGAVQCTRLLGKQKVPEPWNTKNQKKT